MSSQDFSGPHAGLPQHCVAVAVGLALVAAASAANAQSAEPKQLPKISVQEETAPTNKIDEVSSPKFTQPLIDTPQTIAVIGPEILKQQRVTTLSQALRNTPGVTFLLGENGNTSTGDSIFMRGFDTQGSIFVDGIRDIGTVSRDTFNTEQIEIAKGPAGPDYGRGAASGYVNLATKVPVSDAFARSSVSYGTGEQARVTGDVNHRFEGTGTAFRFNAMGQDGDVDGRDHVRQDSWAVAPAVAFGLDSSTRSYLYLLHTEQDNRPDGGVPTIGQEGFFNSFVPAGAPKPDRDNFYGSLSDFEDIEATMVTARIEHDFSENLRLRNTSRYGKLEQMYVLTGVSPLTAQNITGTDPSAWTVNRSRQIKAQENTVITNQTNLSATIKTGSIEHSITTGFEYIYEKQNTPGYTGAGTMTPANLYNPNPRDPVTALALVRSAAYSDGSTTTYGIYAFDTLTLNEHWELTGGLRLDDYKTEFDSVQLATANNNPFNVPVGAAYTFNADSSDTLFSYKVGVLYKPAPNGSVYISHAISQQPPGGANFTLSALPTNLNNPNLDPQEASNLELGTKWDLRDGALALTAAVFRSENKNDLAQPDPTDPTAIQQIGKKRVEGIELGVVGQITDAWQVTAGIAKMDTEVIEGTETQTRQQISWSPELTFTSWTTYVLPFGVTLGAGARYTDTVFRTINNTLTPTSPTANLLQAPDYWVIDAMIGYDINERFSLQLNGYNLADEDYVATLNNSGARYTPGSPRAALLTFNMEF
jgi:catecholate siderophore receptor